MPLVRLTAPRIGSWRFSLHYRDLFPWASEDANVLVDEAIRQRRTVTRFLPDPVSSSELREILALASQAPSIGNRQMWRYIVLTDLNLLRMLADMVERRVREMEQWAEARDEERRLLAFRQSTVRFKEAPAVIVVINQGYHSPLERILVEHGLKYPEVERMFGFPEIQSIGAMIGCLTLAAVSRGYGTCWLTDVLFAQKDLKAALEIASGETIAALVGIGRPDELPHPKAKKPIDGLIDWR